MAHWPSISDSKTICKWGWSHRRRTLQLRWPTFRQGAEVVALLTIGFGLQLLYAGWSLDAQKSQLERAKEQLAISTQQMAQDKSIANAVTKWEYKIEAPSDALFTIEMNILGKEGWEMISAKRATSSGGGSASYEVILRRPIR